MKRDTRLQLAIGALLVVAMFVGYLLVRSEPDFLVKPGDLEATAPSMLAQHDVLGLDASDQRLTCASVDGGRPFAYRSVCAFGPPKDRTVIFATAVKGIEYAAGRGVFYRSSSAASEPWGVCARHVFGRWWEFVSIVKTDPNCPSGFDHYTGAG